MSPYRESSTPDPCQPLELGSVRRHNHLGGSFGGGIEHRRIDATSVEEHAGSFAQDRKHRITIVLVQPGTDDDHVESVEPFLRLLERHGEELGSGSGDQICTW